MCWIKAALERVGGRKTSTSNDQNQVLVVCKGGLGARCVACAHWVKSGWPETSPKSYLCWIPIVSLRPAGFEVPDTPFCLALETKVVEWLRGAQGCLAIGNKQHIVPPNLLFSDINRGLDCLVVPAQHLSTC